MPMRFRRRASGRPTQDAGSSGFATEALELVDPLYATALRLTRNAAAAEDLVQETYLKAFRSEGQFEQGSDLKAWMFTILYNTFRNDRRGAGRNPVRLDEEIVERAATTPSAQADPEQALLATSLDVHVQAALDALPEAFRQAVWLRDVEEFSYSEIARMTNVPVGTVMSRISRGRRLLHERLAPSREPGRTAVEP